MRLESLTEQGRSEGRRLEDLEPGCALPRWVQCQMTYATLHKVRCAACSALLAALWRAVLCCLDLYTCSSFPCFCSLLFCCLCLSHITSHAARLTDAARLHPPTFPPAAPRLPSPPYPSPRTSTACGVRAC